MPANGNPPAERPLMNDQPIRILLVEDNPGDVTLMKIMLSEERGSPFVMDSVPRLSEALERCANDGIDVVLLDLTLPDAQGLDAVIQMHERVPRIPLVVMTGLDDEALALKAMQHGAQDYLVKGSVDGRLLARSIRYTLERTRAARELGEQRARLEMLLQSTPDRIYFKNPKGEFLQVNPALARFFGIENPKDAIGKTDADFFTEEHALKAMSDERDIIQTGNPNIGDVEKETFPDGRTGWSLTTKMPLRDDKGAIVGTFGISRDITKIKAAEEAMTSSEERYRRLLNSVTDYVYTVELNDWQSVSTSHGPGCQAVTGYSAEEFKADVWLWHSIIHPDDRELVVQTFTESTGTSEPLQIEHRIIRRDGAIRWVRNKHVPRYDAAGRVQSYDGLVSDITDRKLAKDEIIAANARLTKVLTDLTKSHEDLKSAQSQLMQVEKLHSIGQLAAGIAHEVKNPLQVILVGLQYLGATTAGADEQTRSVLTEMENAVQRADGVVRDLLDFASPRELGMHPRSINALIEQSLRFMKHDLALGKITVVRTLAADLPEVVVDPTKIEQVFINLFSNACHAMADGGTLTIQSYQGTIGSSDASHDAGDRSGIRFRTGDSVVIIEVEDTGSGIPEDHMQRIFEPFFTTKETGKGTGLGLPITKKIIDLHKGRIRIANRPTGGVTVSLTFKAQNLPKTI